MMFLVLSNWSKGALLEKMDFSPAIAKPAPRSEPEEKPGHPVYYHSASLESGSLSMMTFVIPGKDFNGNLWLTAVLPR
jgi:hypothetical protein